MPAIPPSLTLVLEDTPGPAYRPSATRSVRVSNMKRYEEDAATKETVQTRYENTTLEKKINTFNVL